MRTLLIGAAVFAALCSSVAAQQHNLLAFERAAAEQRYDRKLEQATMDIVAAKMGAIRGGFDYDKAPQMVAVPDEPAPDMVTTGSIVRDDFRKPATVAMPIVADAPPEGLSRAVERKVARIVAF